MKVDKKVRIRFLILLQVSIVIHSISLVFLKLAGAQAFFSLKFLLFYGAAAAILLIYAVLWQILLKNMPLNLAYSNRALTMIWTMVWGYLFFDEKISLNMVGGALIILTGVMLMVSTNE